MLPERPIPPTREERLDSGLKAGLITTGILLFLAVAFGAILGSMGYSIIGGEGGVPQDIGSILSQGALPGGLIAGALALIPALLIGVIVGFIGSLTTRRTQSSDSPSP